MTSPFAGPSSWAANTVYRVAVDEIVAGTFYYLVNAVEVNGQWLTFSETEFPNPLVGTSGSVAPSWPTTFGATVNDNTVQWVCVQNSRVPWRASHAYTSGPLNNAATAPWPYPDQLVEQSGTQLWQCILGGTSASVEPSWPSSPTWPPVGGSTTISDGSVVWALVAFNDI